MLALDDGALARIAIGATRIAPSQRSRWLKSIAKELEGFEPNSNARRARKFRGRRKNGQACFRIVQDEVGLEELLLAAGTLAPADRDDHSKVEAALSRFLSLCILDHGNALSSDREIYDSLRIGLRVSALRKGSDGPPKRFRK
jgi:hypothetical protein